MVKSVKQQIEEEIAKMNRDYGYSEELRIRIREDTNPKMTEKQKERLKEEVDEFIEDFAEYISLLK
jgi:hypothetical protein